MLRRLRLVLGATLIITGCATLMSENRNAYRVSEVDASLTDLRASVTAVLPDGLRLMSSNGRELVSRHFVMVNDRPQPAADALDRYFAQVTILGDRRPYDLEILVSHERRVLRDDRFVYVIVDYSTRLARDLETKIRQELTKRREERNVIDDFRVF